MGYFLKRNNDFVIGIELTQYGSGYNVVPKKLTLESTISQRSSLRRTTQKWKLFGTVKSISLKRSDVHNSRDCKDIHNRALHTLTSWVYPSR